MQASWCQFRLVLFTAALGGSFVLPRNLAAAAERPTGEEIYQRQCAECHGAKGEGNADSYPHPLIGDRSLPELIQYIDKSMPEGEPEKCAGPDAEAVARFVFDSFYSPIAQERNRPVRVELSRLTVLQYRHALADLMAEPGKKTRWGDARGLRGEYYKSRRYRNNEREVERTDPTIQFQFGEGSPAEGKIDAAEFGIRWSGSLIAPETGEYEFNLKTENGARLWINDTEQPLIDAWVKSGTDLDHKQTLFLLGGYAYPLRLEFFKSKEAKEKSASVALEWKLPLRPAEPIPERFLIPERMPQVYVASTPFPPDDRSIGYERGTSISKAWDQATTDAALDLASHVATNLNRYLGRGDEEERQKRCREFCARFAERAFRRPLAPEQKEFFIERHFAADLPLEMSVKRVVLLVLKSPRFLYRELGGEQDGYDVAARLSFGLWDSLPDEQLLQAAAKGELATREQVAAHAERMVGDPRARYKLQQFLWQWLKVDHVPDIAKDPQGFPEFTPRVAADLRTSLELFLEDVVWSESADFRELLSSETLFLNGELAKFYGGGLPAEAPFQKVSMSATERAGVLSHPYLMAGFAYTATSSPIHRGVFLARSILGRALRVPPEAVAPLVADLHPDLTTRERVALQTKPESCQTCHAMLNPLGFSLENFDAIGRFRLEEKGRPVDVSGRYQTRSGEIVEFSGVRELADFLAHSPETHTAFVEQLFHHLVKQPIRAFGSKQSTRLREAFSRHNFNIRKLMVEIMAAAALPAAER